VKILTNFPFEAYAPRAAYRDVEFVTFGHADGRQVAGTTYPFDIAFDSAGGTIEQLLAKVPGAAPDLVLLIWPDQLSIPEGLERCPVRTVGVISDYNLSLPWITGLWPYFDVVLTDRAGIDVFDRLGFADVRYWCQFSFQVGLHEKHPDVERDLDLVFIGNLNPAVQRDRVAWLQRLLALERRGLRVKIVGGVQGEDYAALLNRAKVGFNRAIRGEMNMRSFEVPACGAVLMQERDNREVRDFLCPEREVVLYDDDDFEERLLELLADDPRREAIADAGHARIQEHRMPARFDALLRCLETQGPGRPRDASPADLAIGRAVALLSSEHRGHHAADAFQRAFRVAPDDPRTALGLAMAVVDLDPQRHFEDALTIVDDVLALSPGNVPALASKIWMLERAGRWVDVRAAKSQLGTALLTIERWDQVEGPVLPVGYAARSVCWATALNHAVRHADPRLVGSHPAITAWT